MASLWLMLGDAKKSWQLFKDDEPGRRFEEHYRRRRQNERGWRDPSRLFNVIVGSALVVVSAFFGWAPGLGMLTFFIGLGMIAGEFLVAARFLDWSEVRGRSLWRYVNKLWKPAKLWCWRAASH